MQIVKFGLLSAIAIAAVACGGGAAPTPAGSTATPAGATATPGVPGATATTPPAVIGQPACALVTQGEMDAVFGGTATIEQSEDGTCSVTGPDSLIPIVIRYGENESISAAKMVVDNGEDLTVAGNPAYYGELMGGILYIEKGGQTLVLQAPLSTESKELLIGAGFAAIARFP